jgi:hypothetical protein
MLGEEDFNLHLTANCVDFTADKRVERRCTDDRKSTRGDEVECLKFHSDEVAVGSA